MNYGDRPTKGFLFPADPYLELRSLRIQVTALSSDSCVVSVLNVTTRGKVTLSNGKKHVAGPQRIRA